MGSFLANQIGDGWRVDEKLKNRNEAAGNTGHQPLGKYADQAVSQLGPDLVLLTDFKRIDNPVDRLRSVVGMKSGENQVACLSGRHGGRHCLVSPHFADHNHVDILAESRGESVVKITSINPDFPLINDRLLRLENVFNRIFNGDNMLGPFFVDKVNYRG